MMFHAARLGGKRGSRKSQALAQWRLHHATGACAGTLLPQILPFTSQGDAGERCYKGVSVFGDGAGVGAHSSVISAWSLLI